MSAGCVWIFGTSNSIMEAGYVPHLKRILGATALRNCAIGDQTSLMGLMRLGEVAKEIGPEDLVVWEYPLLDELLARAGIDPGLILRSAETAWQMILARTGNLVVVYIPPRGVAAGRDAAPVAAELLALAHKLAVPIVDVRSMLPTDTAGVDACYVDERHLAGGAPAVVQLAERLAKHHTQAHDRQPSHPARPTLIWRNIAGLPLSEVRRTRFENRLISVETITLSPGNGTVALPRKPIAVGVVATRNTGGLWCGHRECPVCSTRLLPGSPRPALLRATRLACLRLDGEIQLRSARPANGQRQWHDYGFDPENIEGEVAIFGFIFDQAPLTPRPPPGPVS